ncbi:MAG TPA: ATP-binding protein [Candidatus Binataceae bacterium]|nr:ATP-binding protein [Candidatus Binataceae bacterium]
MAAAVAAGFLPPALALVIMMSTGVFFPVWALIAIGAGMIAGGVAAVAIANSIIGRAERIEALAAALRGHRAPGHVIPDDGDIAGRAERSLLQAADTVISEIGALTEQRDELEAILRSMTEAVVLTGARGEVILLNGQARKTFALNAEANYQGHDFVELCRDPRLQEFVASSTGSANGEITTAEVHIQNPSPRYLAVSAAPVRRGSGSGVARLFVFHDITQLKTYETMRADFVANLTHEIRTPLSALYGYAETLEHGVEDPETAKRFLGIIERQAKRLARLVDDLLSLSNLERGLSPLKLEEVAPRSVLEDAAELMRERAERGGVALMIDAPVELPPMHADRDKMHQVFLNLIDNAIKYTPRGGRVTLVARVANRPAPTLEMIVADTGEGIPASDIPRLTERFYRVDRARSRELGGTGLGLAIVKHIVQLHHGAMNIESRVGEGTSVTIALPMSAS